MTPSASLTIGQVADRTGITEATIRAWERRFGFPTPTRQPSGHRRYTPADCAQIDQVRAERDAGLSLAAAIERVRVSVASPASRASIAARMRAHPGVPAPSLLTLPTMRALSHAIEDEASASAGRAVLVASFQTEGAFRRSEHRWRSLSAGAELAVVLAAFDRASEPIGGPVERPVPDGSPLRNEWVVACYGPTCTAALAAWERPTPPRTPDDERLFEAVWTVEPAVTRDAVEVALSVAGSSDPDLLTRARTVLDRPPDPGAGTAAAAVALANRMVAYVAAANR